MKRLGRHCALRAPLLFSTLWLCYWAQPAAGESALPAAGIYERATNWFAEAVFLKPSGGRQSELISQLAPLLLQEVTPSRPGADASSPLSLTNRASRFTFHVSRLDTDAFGCLSLTNGLLALDRTRPTIYATADVAQIRGKPHIRATYLWCYSVEPGDGLPQTALPLQGIRITLNSAGRPGVWEVLAEDSPAELLFVSEGLEAAAQAQFGKPLPGRRYAIERDAADTPRAVVARTVDDAADAMGPILYLRAGTHAVSTLICRCTASQVRHLAATTTYNLVADRAAPADPILVIAKARAGSQTAFWPGEEAATNRLEQCLRLPAGF